MTTVEKTHVIKTPQGDITLSTGKIANLAAGAVMVQKGGTVILSTATVENTVTDKDYFPLAVEYLERFYAAGTLSGSRFNKREGFPNEDAILMARQIDHSIRPLFPKAFKQPVNVILTNMANDGVNDPEGMTVLAASAALMLAGIPYAGPAASVVVAVEKDGSLSINPSRSKQGGHDYLGEFVVSGTSDKILNIEGWGIELTDEQMDEVLDAAMKQIGELNKGLVEFAKGLAKPVMQVPENTKIDQLAALLEKDTPAITEALFTTDKASRDGALTIVKEELKTKYLTDDSEYSSSEFAEAFDYVSKQIVRTAIIKDKRRVSGRKLDQVRELLAEVDVLPSVHGSALFSRGYTQSLSIATLGSTAKGKGFDDMEGEETNVPFMHHYNFPPYSTGESGRVNYKPGRREIGHGVIGANGLKNMIADQDAFPYAIRVVSEITTSNGSTSMAATCAASMALMAAGVPMKAAVGGIGVGLICEDDSQSNYNLLLDIEGIEDFYGDMDFKVTGTRKGMTAIQFETKLEGVKPEILKESFRLANTGRQQVLDVMDAAISESRSELAETAPRVEVVTIPQDKIGELIGPGGKNIKGITAAAEEMAPGQVEIDIADDGKVTVTATSKVQSEYILERINMMVEGPKLNEIYEGPVTKIVDFGAFVEIVPGIEGLLHISEISKERVNNVSDHLTEGQVVRVKLVDKKPGRFSLSMKQVD